MNTPTRQLQNGILPMFAVIAIGFLGRCATGRLAPGFIGKIITTIFGVGYGETNVMTPGLRSSTIGFIVAGCIIPIYTVGAFIIWLSVEHRCPLDYS